MAYTTDPPRMRTALRDAVHFAGWCELEGIAPIDAATMRHHIDRAAGLWAKASNSARWGGATDTAIARHQAAADAIAAHYGRTLNWDAGLFPTLDGGPRGSTMLPDV